MKLGAIGIDRNKWFLRKCTVDRRAELSLWPPLTGNIKYRKTRNRNFFPPLMPHKKLFIYLFIYQLFWTQACPEGMCTNGTQVPCEVPSLPNPTTRKGWPHHRGLRPLLFSNSDVGSFTSHENKSVKVLWERTYGFSSLSEKTRKSYHLQMPLQRQHFLLSYLKTLSVGLAGVWTRDLLLSTPAFYQLR